MTTSQFRPGVHPGRLPPADYCEAFADVAPPLTAHQAQVAAARCYFCAEAPCTTACPSDIDVPLFIRQILTGTPEAAAKTILSQNIMGGMCARVCPTETLCEGACVREAAEGKPVEIGALQRYATDTLQASGVHPFARAPRTEKSVAVVGAGPAGLACAHRLAMLGHEVTVYDARLKPGGLNEYGIAAYKAPGGFAAKEVAWLLQIGGIAVLENWKLGRNGSVADLLKEHDAVFLGMGLAGVNALTIPGAEFATPATDFIAHLRQAEDLATVPVGRRVVVIGGGMTAVDAAVQAKLLGAETASIVYRRSQAEMPASAHEQDHAQTHGVRIVPNAAPVAIRKDEQGYEVEFARTETRDGKLVQLDDTLRIKADQIFTAIGQTLGPVPEGLTITGGKIEIDAQGRTGLSHVWAGGDCATGGEDLTVNAVAQGRDAAEDIHAFLMGA
ncbi:NADPH-dependent glutamate synthase beta subunit-like oxidoreductase [Rhodobacter viridis]|uniref:dihydrouracil dehydrogenase (NAD(+)) n=1 Tax=Rhodobacter viridis TaxID=1054202 RepID=A0A318U228_9RHOB|nr:NAD(P)-dependent oxidoreductase [Rhodobacter viridis]PYF10341.1 NADPH-dependent glutamate synthase beta subunit-like oxidoreductase [Rhodobacter viridis]